INAAGELPGLHDVGRVFGAAGHLFRAVDHRHVRADIACGDGLVHGIIPVERTISPLSLPGLTRQSMRSSEDDCRKVSACGIALWMRGSSPRLTPERVASEDVPLTARSPACRAPRRISPPR